jgi:hypothetical protein
MFGKRIICSVISVKFPSKSRVSPFWSSFEPVYCRMQIEVANYAGI